MDHDAIQLVNLCLVVDRSGSMNGDKLAAATKSCREVVAGLAPDDRLTIVAYADGADVVVQPTTPRGDVAAVLDGLDTGGSSNLSLGWCQGLLEIQDHTTAAHRDRVVILSDGVANAGETDRSTLAAIGARAHATGVTTSTVAVGDDAEEDLLVAIAAAAGGHFWSLTRSPVEDLVAVELRGAPAPAPPLARRRVALNGHGHVGPRASGITYGGSPAGREVARTVADLVEPYADVPEVQVFRGHWQKAPPPGAHRGAGSPVAEVLEVDDAAIVGVAAEAIALTHRLAQLDPANTATLERHRATLRAQLAANGLRAWTT